MTSVLTFNRVRSTRDEKKYYYTYHSSVRVNCSFLDFEITPLMGKSLVFASFMSLSATARKNENTRVYREANMSTPDLMFFPCGNVLKVSARVLLTEVSLPGTTP